MLLTAPALSFISMLSSVNGVQKVIMWLNTHPDYPMKGSASAINPVTTENTSELFSHSNTKQPYIFSFSFCIYSSTNEQYKKL